MPLIPIPQGSNYIINRPLQQANGAAMSAANIVASQVELIQRGVVKATIPFAASPSPFRSGADGNSTDLELTKPQILALDKAPLTERYTFEVTANAYVASAAKKYWVVSFTEHEIE